MTENIYNDIKRLFLNDKILQRNQQGITENRKNEKPVTGMITGWGKQKIGIKLKINLRIGFNASFLGGQNPWILQTDEV